MVAHSDLSFGSRATGALFLPASTNLRVVGLPFDLPRIELRQFWHHKLHTDPLNRWLRTMIYNLFHGRRAVQVAERRELRVAAG